MADADNNNNNSAAKKVVAAPAPVDIDALMAMFDEPEPADQEDARRQRLVAATPSDLPLLETFHFSGATIALAELAAHFGSEAVARFATFLGDPKQYLDLLGRLIVLGRKLPDLDTNAEHLEIAKSYPPEQLSNAAKAYQWIRHLVTPMNLMPEFMGVTIQKLAIDEGREKYFTVGNSTVKITFDTEVNFYKQLLPIFQAAEKMQSRTLYEVFPYDEKVIKLTLLLGTRVSIKEGDKVWTYTPAPAADPDVVSVSTRLEGICNLVAQVLCSELKITHWYQDVGHPLDMLYVCIAKHKFEGKTKEIVDRYHAEMNNPNNKFGSFCERPTAEQIDAVYNKYSQNDILLAQAKQMLNDTKKFTGPRKAVAEWLEDITTPNRVAHFKISYWGLLSKVLIMQRALTYFKIPPKQMYFYGQGADKLAQGLEKGQELGFFKNIVWPGTPTWLHGLDNSLRSVPGTIGGAPPTKLVAGSILHMFSMTQKEEEYITHLNRAYGQMIWDPLVPSVMTCQHGLSLNEVFNSVIFFAKEKDLHIEVFRHHRYHNDAIQWIFTNAQPYDKKTTQSLVRERIIMEFQVLGNNIFRNNQILTGNYHNPDAEDDAIINAQGVAYAIQQYSKRLKTAANIGKIHDQRFMDGELDLTSDIVTGKKSEFNPMGVKGITAEQFSGKVVTESNILTIPASASISQITSEEEERRVAALTNNNNFLVNNPSPPQTPPPTTAQLQSQIAPYTGPFNTFPAVIRKLLAQAEVTTPPIHHYMIGTDQWDQAKLNELQRTLLAAIEASNPMEVEKSKRPLSPPRGSAPSVKKTGPATRNSKDKDRT